MRHLLAAEEGREPFGRGLLAGDEALGAELDVAMGSARDSSKKILRRGRARLAKTHNACGRVDMARKGVDGDDMGRLLVPGTIFAPVVDGDLFPGVLEVVGGGEELHFGDEKASTEVRLGVVAIKSSQRASESGLAARASDKASASASDVGVSVLFAVKQD